MAGVISKRFDKYCVGIDISKAFDNVDRNKLIDILRSRKIPEENITLIKKLLTNTILELKVGKKLEDKFQTNKGVPQGDGLSPRLFTVYLDEAIRESDEIVHANCHDYHRKETATPLHGHECCKTKSSEIPWNLEFADDVVFLCNPVDEVKTVIEVTTKAFLRYNLLVNDSKKEVFRYHKNSGFWKIKKLGTLLDEKAENNRKHLAELAMSKYHKIMKNKFINVRTKTKIYNVYVRSILLYNCSTWAFNETINKQLDSFHRRQLRQCLDVRYPKVIKIDHLYDSTKEFPISEHIRARRAAHLGHLLRRIHPVKDILQHIKRLPPVEQQKRIFWRRTKKTWAQTTSTPGSRGLCQRGYNNNHRCKTELNWTVCFSPTQCLVPPIVLNIIFILWNNLGFNVSTINSYDNW